MHEAKARMPYTEFLDWVSYRQMRGSLHTGMNLERGFALFAWMFQRAYGGSMRMEEFMPHFDQANTQADGLPDLATVAKMIGAVPRRG